jgi:hypothetical protein
MRWLVRRGLAAQGERDGIPLDTNGNLVLSAAQKSRIPVLPAGFSTHSPTHKFHCLARLPRTLAVPAVL